MWFGILTLLTALIISISAAYYSILGLTAIFAAAFWPIVILGSSLEVGKIVSTLWLHKYWDRAEAQYKVYLCTAVAILMLLTSMGVFGFLSKAHSDQDLVSGDVVAKIAIYDEKIKQARDNIDMARRALTQMDAAVDQTLGRSSTEQGADKAAQLRRSQSAERNRLLKEIDTEQKKVQKISEERAPIAAEVRKVEAEVGPIKYIAALIYGDNPEANLLDKAVRWVIILIVVVFDPLALTLLLAATKSIEWERKAKASLINRKEPEYEPEYEPDDGPLTDDQIEQIKEMSKAELPTGNVVTKDTLFPEAQEFFDHARQTAQRIDDGTYKTPVTKPPVDKRSVLDVVNNIWPQAKKMIIRDSESDHAALSSLADQNAEKDLKEKEARRLWKVAHPDDTIHHQERLFNTGQISQLPWHESDLVADNNPHATPGEIKGFGTEFPSASNKGDMFLRVDQLPSKLYKFNGSLWIEVDKLMSDTYAWDDAYVDYLINKIDSGEYDPELLSDAERNSIEIKLAKG
jgi:hypothetical protein